MRDNSFDIFSKNGVCFVQKISLWCNKENYEHDYIKLFIVSAYIFWLLKIFVVSFSFSDFHFIMLEVKVR